MPEYDYIFIWVIMHVHLMDYVHLRWFYRFTRQAVMKLFSEGCQLVILACNTASAKALRTIQQRDLPDWDPATFAVLGVIRPTVEMMDQVSTTKHIGILGTAGTISSHSYSLEIEKMFPHITVTESPVRCGFH